MTSGSTILDNDVNPTTQESGMLPDIAAVNFAAQLVIFLVCGGKSLLMAIDPQGTACVSLFDRVFAYTAVIASLITMAVMLSLQG